MNWTFTNYKHYSAEHMHKAEKARLAAESLIEREAMPKKLHSKRHPRNRT